MSTTSEPFRTFCTEIAKTEDIRVYCNDWTALEIALERYLQSQSPPVSDDEAMEVLGVQKA
jgi:hypothetical protein